MLRDLSLWEKRKDPIQTLSGGMKRRVMIAKALAHEPSILFLDEPTAGVDVELRRDMWALVRGLREGGVTIILTTHYIDEAEEMADRIGVINKGELIVVEEQVDADEEARQQAADARPAGADDAHPRGARRLASDAEGAAATSWNTVSTSTAEHTGVPSLLRRLSDLGIALQGSQHAARARSRRFS